MPAITIMNHGTANSTNRNTSGGSELVISKIGTLLAGADGTNWIPNEGAGTAELARQRGQTPSLGKEIAGAAYGDGVEHNVQRSVAFVTAAYNRSGRALTVNLAGHSRGSITCYKIASELFKTVDPDLDVNIFAIDPVPGNNGVMNAEMHDNLSIRNNVKHSFLMLAESEHRLNFRPYVDGVYAAESTEKGHKFDTIPGTHGGINELSGNESEAAALVLSRALRFLIKRGSLFNPDVAQFLLDDVGTVRMYSKLMMRIRKYKLHATVNPFKSLKNGLGNLAMTSGNVDKHRIVNVAGSKHTWGTQGNVVPTDGGRDNHHGLGMNAALRRMGVEDPHSARSKRFFANKEHQKIFGQQYSVLACEIANLEKSASDEHVKALKSALGSLQSQVVAMSPPTQAYLLGYCQKWGII